MPNPDIIRQIKQLSGATSATIGVQTSHAHGVGIKPKFYFILVKGGGVVYEGATPDATSIYLKGTQVSLQYTAVLFW